MKPLAWLLLAALASCAPATPPHTALPPPAHLMRADPPEPAPAPEPTAHIPSQATTTATRAYDKAERGEVPAINATVANGTATAASVNRIHQADLAARAAVRRVLLAERVLAAMDGHPTAAAKEELRRAAAESDRATEELIAATEATP